MSIKQISLLVASVLAMVVLVVPASASAQTTLTHNDVHVSGSVDYTQSFEGFIDFTLKEVAGLTKHGVFGCEVTVTVTVTSPTSAELIKYQLTTQTCEGEGFYDNCSLMSHSSTVPWALDVTASDLEVTNAKVTTSYTGCTSGVVGSTIEFAKITLIPHLDEQGTIETLTLSATSTNTLVTTTGELHLHEGEPTLGVT